MTSATIASRVRIRAFNWRLFLSLWGLGAFGLLAIVPYGLTAAGQQFDRSTMGLVAVQFLPQMAVLAIQISLGLFLGSRLGLGAPLLSARLAGERLGPGVKVLLVSALLGLVAGGVTLVLDLWLFAPALAAEARALDILLPQNANPPAWQGFLASFYGGINEEVAMRLCLFTLLAWLGAKVLRSPGGRPTTRLLWGVTILAGLAFALSHLPGLVALDLPLTPLTISRTLILNASGILLGWLYWRRGLESAMVAHFSLDLVLHVVGAALLSL